MRVTHACVARLWSDGRPGQPDDIACDLVAMTGGWTPSVHLFSQSRGKLKFDSGHAHVPARRGRAGHGLRGRLRGRVRSGQGAGRSGARGGGGGERPLHRGRRKLYGPGTLGLVAPLPDDKLAKAFVDFQNDVTARDVKLATQEGMRSIEHIKRYTTSGMATDQGKTSNMNALAIAAESLGREIAEVGLTTFRLPYTPVTFGIFAGPSKGQMFDPVRKTAIHPWYESEGRRVGGGGPVEAGEPHSARAGRVHDQTLARECLTTRAKAGIMDASTLGKIEVVGPDAAEFLNRLYINAYMPSWASDAAAMG